MLVLIVATSLAASGCAALQRAFVGERITEAEALIADLEVDIATWSGFAPAAASITFDDGTRDHYLVAPPILEEYGVRATFFLISHVMDDGIWDDHGTPRALMSWDEAAELADAGHEIAGHSATHRDLSSPEADLEYQIVESRRRIEERLPGVRAETFAWPFWRSSPEARRVAARTYIAARGGAPTPQMFRDSVETYPTGPTPEEIHNVNAFGIRPVGQDDEWREVGDAVAAAGGWIVINLHGLQDGTVPGHQVGWAPISDDDLAMIVEELIERDLWIVPFREAAAYMLHRDHAQLSLEPLDDTRVSLAVTGAPGVPHFDVPLTVRVTPPPGGTDILVGSAGDARVTRDAGRSWVVELYPDGDPVIIEPQSLVHEERSQDSL